MHTYAFNSQIRWSVRITRRFSSFCASSIHDCGVSQCKKALIGESRDVTSEVEITDMLKLNFKCYGFSVTFEFGCC